MKKTMIAGAIIASLSLATAVEAKKGNYYGISVTQFNIDGSWFEADVMTLDGRFGTYFNENFSGELRAGFGIQDDTVNFDLNSSMDLEMKNHYGAYIRAGIPVGEVFYPYVIAGYTHGKVEETFLGGSISESESDFSYGLGADFALSNDFDISLEYMDYLDMDGVEVEGISLGFKARF